MTKRFTLMAISWAIVCGFMVASTGCKKEEKPAGGAGEDVSKEMDQAAEEMGEAAEEMGDAAGEAGEAVMGAAEEAGDALGDLSSEVEAKLAQADVLDGSEDHVVHRCAACLLKMDGSEEYSLKVGKYTMHFCTAKCRERFEDDPSEAILAMKIPEGDEGT